MNLAINFISGSHKRSVTIDNSNSEEMVSLEMPVDEENFKIHANGLGFASIKAFHSYYITEPENDCEMTVEKDFLRSSDEKFDAEKFFKLPKIRETLNLILTFGRFGIQEKEEYLMLAYQKLISDEERGEQIDRMLGEDEANPGKYHCLKCTEIENGTKQNILEHIVSNKY